MNKTTTDALPVLPSRSIGFDPKFNEILQEVRRLSGAAGRRYSRNKLVNYLDRTYGLRGPATGVEEEQILDEEVCELFPFSVPGDSITHIWINRKPKGLMWNRIDGEVLSASQLKIRAFESGNPVPIFDDVLVVDEADLVESINAQKRRIAENVWEERQAFVREDEIKALILELFPEGEVGA